jgi:ribosomal protein S18 acetylase RimI-like enzyme
MDDTQEIVIRRSIHDDAPYVFELLNETWDSTYSSFIPRIDLTNYLNNNYNTSKLEAVFLDANYECFTVLINNKVAAWLKLFNDTEKKRFYLSSIYVSPEFQKFKIGKKLMTLSYQRAVEKGLNSIWIGVMTLNTKALDWYKREGFIFNEELPFKMNATSVPHLIGQKILI